MPKLEVRDCSRAYGKEQVLDRVSFTVEEGEFLAILGPSGCGKTTLLRVLTGLVAPDRGQILMDGVDITHAAPDCRGIGIVFQNYALFENMTVRKNVSFALENRGEGRTAAREKAMEMLRLVGLEDYAEKTPSKLSGGQQQRVAIARTLAMNPNVILFDEPMAALDAENRIVLRDEIRRLQRELGSTILYVTHDQQEAFMMADRIMVMGKGRIHQLDTPENILRTPADDYVQGFVKNNLLRGIRDLQRFADFAEG